MTKRNNPWLLVPLVLMLGAGAPVLADVGTDPATHQEGFECIIDLTDLGSALPSEYSGPTTISIIGPESGTTSRLCTGSYPSENIKIHCDAPLPVADISLAGLSSSGFTCMIDTDPCDVVAESGLVVARNSQLSIDETGSTASLTCHW